MKGIPALKMSDDPAGGGYLPYFRGSDGYEEVGQTYFSPNRLVSSPVMFRFIAFGNLLRPSVGDPAVLSTK
jgi:hypothetical protein